MAGDCGGGTTRAPGLHIGVLFSLICWLSPFFAAAESTATQARAESVTFSDLGDGVWLHRSLRDIEPWGLIPTHGLIVDTGADILLVDTAWNDAQTGRVLDWAEQRFGRPVTAAVLTHAHSDKMGGVAALRERGVRSFANALSNRLAPQRGLLPADEGLLFDSDGDLLPAGRPQPAGLQALEVFYPGPAHTADNIVVHVPSAGILFGGCMIRPGGSTDLGNTADADTANWAAATARAGARFPRAEVIVPSHGPPGSRALLDLTMALAEAHGQGKESTPP